MNNNLKQTLRFVSLIATPLCLTNSIIFSLESSSFWFEMINRFLLNFLITFPQAVLYVSIVKWYDNINNS